MPETTQSFSSHTRWHTPYHFVLFPILLIHFAWCIWRITQELTFEHAEQLLLSFGLLLMLFLVRVNPLKAQDRVIRLEEQLRYQRLLPADLAARAGALPVGFIVAMRFASDHELPELAQRAVDGGFAKPKDLKEAIKNWRGDYHRV
ncbi:MAG: hypothetical protein KA368_09460 [Acidobacteria bacterium]|nr:hypothetical protein [Acidobacteriota bacterium]